MEQNYVFEVLAREGHRVDKVLVLTMKTAGTNPKSADAVDSSDALIVHPPSARCRNPGPRPNLATPRQQRGRAAASIGSEHQKNLRAAQWWILQSFPASAGPIPKKSTQAERDGAGASIGTSTPLSPLVRQRESPIYPHVPCERRPHPAEPLSANPLH